jgi:hypothetical protein
MAKYEHELTAFAGLGLDDVEMDTALTFLLLSFVQASASSPSTLLVPWAAPAWAARSPAGEAAVR